VLGDRAVAVTASSRTYPDRELEEAKDIQRLAEALMRRGTEQVKLALVALPT